MKKGFGILLALMLPLCNSAWADEDDLNNVVEERKFRKGRRWERVKNQNSEFSREIQIGRVRVRGAGCPAGTTSVSLSPDKKTLTLLFDQFSNEVGGDTGKKREVKRCRVVAPLKIPRGLKVAVVALDYRGYNSLPQGARTRLRTAHFFSHRQNGDRRAKKVVRKFDFKGPLDDEFLVTSEAESNMIWSACGKNTRMGFVTALRTRTNRQGEEALSTVDSIDGVIGSSSHDAKNRLKYHLFWKRCRGGDRDRDQRRGPGRRRPRRR